MSQQDGGRPGLDCLGRGARDPGRWTGHRGVGRASKRQGMTYNRFIQGLGLAGVEVDRRMLAELAVNDINAFNALVKVAKDALPEDVNAPKA